MIDIPKNPTPRNFDADVDEAVRVVLKDLQSSAYSLEITTYPTDNDI